MKQIILIATVLLFCQNINSQIVKEGDTLFIGCRDYTDTAIEYYMLIRSEQHYNVEDSFLIEYKHCDSYFDDLVGRLICDSGLVNCREDTEYYRKHRHYDAAIDVYAIENGKRTKVGDRMYGYYVENGCYEDVPEVWIRKAITSIKKKKKNE